MKFAKLQIKVKKHGLEHTIPWKYKVQGGPCEN